MADKLAKYREVWKNKKILKLAYFDWYKKILKDLKNGCGKTVELGAGTGNFKEYKPDTISSDIEKCDWLDMSFDAHKMPFSEYSISNIVMIDVLHHLSNPVKFFQEAIRVLKKRGRILIVEPYPSLFSLFVYKKFHPEPFLMNMDYFADIPEKQKDPWQSNQAISYLLFFKHKRKFLEKFGNDLKVIKIKKMSFLLYPLSGGFENKSLAPDFMIPILKIMEIFLTPFRKFLAFRCYVVLEKITDKI